MPSTPTFFFFPRGSAWGSNWEFDSSTISLRFIAIESRISGRISLKSTSITLGILGRTSSITKEDLRFWSFRDLIAPTWLTFDSQDSSQAPINGDFGPLSKELYDLRNILKSDTIHTIVTISPFMYSFTYSYLTV
jgi:hypothetical protein